MEVPTVNKNKLTINSDRDSVGHPEAQLGLLLLKMWSPS